MENPKLTAPSKHNSAKAPKDAKYFRLAHLIIRTLYPNGPQQLMLAVLLDAINLSIRYLKNPKKPKKEFQDAHYWIKSNDVIYFYSFKNVCYYLKIDPDYVRRGIEIFAQRTLQKSK